MDAKPFKGNAVATTGKKLKGGRVRFHFLAAVAHSAQGQAPGKPYTIKLWATKTITTKTWEKFLKESHALKHAARSRGRRLDDQRRSAAHRSMARTLRVAS